MATGQPRFTDPDHVRETLCTGPCWTSGYTNDTMQIVLTATRHDVAMISEGRFTQPPDYVVVARIVMTTKGALELAEAIKSTVAKHQAMTGRLHSRVFYDFPAERWKHLRTTNVVESSFATVRHPTVRQGMSLEQHCARHDLQARRGR